MLTWKRPAIALFITMLARGMTCARSKRTRPPARTERPRQPRRRCPRKGRQGQQVPVHFLLAGRHAAEPRDAGRVPGGDGEDWRTRPTSVEIQIDDPAEKPIVARYGVSRSPMPLVLAIAPNGAITKGFATRFDENQLRAGVRQPRHGRVHEGPPGPQARAAVRRPAVAAGQASVAARRACRTSPRTSSTRRARRSWSSIPAIRPRRRSSRAFRSIRRRPRPVTVLMAPPGRRRRHVRRRSDQGRTGRQAQGGAIGLLPRRQVRPRRLQLPCTRRRPKPCDCERWSCARFSSARANC